MDLVVSFWLIITIIAVSLAFYLIKGIFKAIMFSIFIISILMGVCAYFVISDALDMKANLMSKENLMVLEEGNKVLAAFSFKNLSGDGLNNINALKNEDFKTIENSITSNNFKVLNEKYYKVFVFDYNTFKQSLSNGLDYSIGSEKGALSGSQTKELLDSGTPIKDLFRIMDKSENLDMSSSSVSSQELAINDFMQKLGISSQEQFKSYILTLMIADFVKEKGPAGLISKIKNKELSIYPNTALFRAIKLVPNFLINKITGKMTNLQAEKTWKNLS